MEQKTVSRHSPRRIAAFRDLRLQSKLLIAMVGLTFLSVAASGSYLLYNIYNNLTEQSSKDLETDVSSGAAGIDAFLSDAEADVLYLSQGSPLETYLRAVESGDTASIRAARASLEKDYYAFAQARLIYDQVRFIDADGLEIVRVNTSRDGVSTMVPQSQLQNKADHGYFKNSIGLSEGSVYASALDLNVEQGKIEEPHKPMIRYATPVYVGGKLYGIVVTNILAENFLAPLGGETTPSFLVDGDGYYLYHNRTEKRWGRDLQTEITVDDDFPELAPRMLSGESGSFTTGGQIFTYQPVSLPGESETRWFLASQLSLDEAFASANRALTIGLVLLLGILLVAAGFSLFTGRAITSPLVNLTQTAEKLATGDFNARSKIQSADEVGVLANTFNSMAAQLSELIGSLEQRVAARTRDLEIVAEVGTATATILETDRLLQKVVDLTRERFDLYHSHIYLLDEEGKNLVLAAGAGEPGRIMAAEKRSIPINREKSLVARAARERKGVTINDVTLAPDFLPNPLLPNTRSEMAVPMLIGETLIGVFDIQSDVADRFTDSDINIQTTLASQMASSVQNARSYERSKAQADFESLVNTINQKIQRAGTVEETLQIAIRELGTAIGASRVKAVIATHQNTGNN